MAAVAETHLSVVVFVGGRVYKLKKPLTTGFVDFSTRERRQAACLREVELNRRLAPDAYLGVADVSGPDGALCDHLVVMRRLPSDRRLSTLVTEGTDLTRPLQQVVRAIATFHATAARGPSIDEAATAAAIRRNWQDNAAQLLPFAGSTIEQASSERVLNLADGYLAGRGPLFEQRMAAGRVCDGHGDLLADDIFCLDDGPRIIDCIEFDDRLRHGDVLADVAFLAMDLERLGAPRLAERLLTMYSDVTGDRWPISLAHHYVAYRAQVRAKVACLRHTQGDEAAGKDAVVLLDLARNHLESGRVLLTLVGGLPGAGKTTLATALGQESGAQVLRSDVLRKELVGLPPDQPTPARFGDGLYRPEHTAATYRELLTRAGDLLAAGSSVILDASWSAGAQRTAAEGLARSTSSELVEILASAPTRTREQRLADRRASHEDASDADAEISRAMATRFDPWLSATTVAMSGSVHEAVTAGLRVLTQARRRP